MGGSLVHFIGGVPRKKRLRQNVGRSKCCAKVSKLGTLVKQVLHTVGLGD